MNMNMLMALSGMFSQDSDLIITALLSIITAVLVGMPSFLMESLFKCSFKMFSMLGVVLFTGMSLVSLYSSMTVAALITVEESNVWVMSYLSSYLIEFAMMTPIMDLMKLKMFECAIQGGTTCACSMLSWVMEGSMNPMME